MYAKDEYEAETKAEDKKVKLPWRLIDVQEIKKKEILWKQKKSWWSLKIHDYPNFKPNDVDLDHIAELIKQGYDQGELIQEEDEEEVWN